MADLIAELSHFRNSIRKQVERGQQPQVLCEKSSPTRPSRGSSSYVGSQRPLSQIDSQIASLKQYVTGGTSRSTSNSITLPNNRPPKPSGESFLNISNQSEIKATPSSSIEHISFVQRYLQAQQMKEKEEQMLINNSSFFSHKDKENMSQASNTKSLPRQRTNPPQENNSKFGMENPHKATMLDDREIEEQVTIQQLQRIQDVLIDSTDAQFNRISLRYVEEMIRLSSVIMYRVKNSRFYKQVEYQ